MDEAETGLKSALAVKIFGADLRTLEQKGKAIKKVLERVRGIRDITLVQELGQPSLTITIDRARIARYGVNVADINALIQTAIGGDVATQVEQGEKQFDLIVRLDQQYRDNPDEIGNILVATPGGPQIPLKEFADIRYPTARRSFTARTIRATSGCSSRWKAAISPARSTTPCSRSAAASPCRRAIAWTGAASIRTTPPRARNCASSCR